MFFPPCLILNLEHCHVWLSKWPLLSGLDCKAMQEHLKDVLSAGNTVRKRSNLTTSETLLDELPVSDLFMLVKMYCTIVPFDPVFYASAYILSQWPVLFPVTIITSDQSFVVGVQIILRQRRCDIGVTLQPVKNKHMASLLWLKRLRKDCSLLMINKVIKGSSNIPYGF